MQRQRIAITFRRSLRSVCVRKAKKTDTRAEKITMFRKWTEHVQAFLPIAMSKASSMSRMFMSPAVRR